MIDDEKMRLMIAEEIVRHHYGKTDASDRRAIPRRKGTIRHRWGFELNKRDGWFPVTRAEVNEARLRSFRAGVTRDTYMDFHLLRRNYEADPTVLTDGMWREVHRDPPPVIPPVLALFWDNGPINLMALMDDLGRPDHDAPEAADELRDMMAEILADMCRPLQPRRSWRRRSPARAQLRRRARPEDQGIAISERVRDGVTGDPPDLTGQGLQERCRRLLRLVERVTDRPQRIEMLPLEERLAVALVLNRPEFFPDGDFTILQAVAHLNGEWLAAATAAEKALAARMEESS